MQLDRKIVLITGAGSGIGRALAVELSQLGARMLLVGRRTDKLEETRALLARRDFGCVLRADITDPADRDELVRRVQSWGRLDVLVNNAGVVVSGPLSLDDAERRRRMIDTNLAAPIELTVALLPLLTAAAPSRIVNVGSLFGDIAFPYFSAYSATKFGLRGWSDGLRRELAPAGIGVTYVAPRGTRTAAAASFAALAAAFAMPLDPPEIVARQIAGAIAADARVVYPKGIERLFVLLQRLMPAAIDQALSRRLAVATTRLRTGSLAGAGLQNGRDGS
jgi:short-subunit dehydrogenase